MRVGLQTGIGAGGNRRSHRLRCSPAPALGTPTISSSSLADRPSSVLEMRSCASFPLGRPASRFSPPSWFGGLRWRSPTARQSAALVSLIAKAAIRIRRASAPAPTDAPSSFARTSHQRAVRPIKAYAMTIFGPAIMRVLLWPRSHPPSRRTPLFARGNVVSGTSAVSISGLATRPRSAAPRDTVP
jgi:hypothetical protein